VASQTRTKPFQRAICAAPITTRTAIQLIACSNCGEPSVPHRACSACGLLRPDASHDHRRQEAD